MTESVFKVDKNYKPRSLLKTYSLVVDSLAETDVTEDIPVLLGDIGLTTDSLPETFTTNLDTANHTLSPHVTTTSTEP